VPKSDCQNTKVKVYRLFFLNTLNLERDSFLRWLKYMSAMANVSESPSTTAHSHKVLKCPLGIDGLRSEWLKVRKCQGTIVGRHQSTFMSSQLFDHICICMQFTKPGALNKIKIQFQEIPF
jgi:hypothetical protein